MNNSEKNLGKYLQELRQTNNLSIEDIAQMTKINLNILKNLENNNDNALPNSTYVKGFIKNYCKACKSDYQQALDLWDKSQKQIDPSTIPNDVNQTNSLQSTEVPSQKSASDKNKINNQAEINKLNEKMSKIGLILAQKKYIKSILLILIIAVLSNKVYKFLITIDENSPSTSENKKVDQKDDLNDPARTKLAKSELELKNSKSVEKVTSPEATNSSPVTIRENDTISNEATIENSQHSKVANTQLKEETSHSLEEVKSENKNQNSHETELIFPEVTFYPISPNNYSISANSKESEDPDLFPQDIRKNIEQNMQQVFINAIYGDTWVTYKVDDKKIKSYNLKQGKNLLIKGKIILLLVGNIKSVVAFLNDKLITSNTKSNVKVFVFPKNIAKDYNIPLFPADSKGRLYTSKEYKNELKKQKEQN